MHRRYFQVCEGTIDAKCALALAGPEPRYVERRAIIETLPSFSVGE